MQKKDEIMVEGYEKVIHHNDPETGLRAIIAVHDTTLGPAVGGTRLYPYANEDDALTDVLRLSRGMTYKSALAGIDFGGGKSVIIADPSKKTPDLLKAFGKFVNTLEGKYICAEDMNTSPEDMEIVHQSTPYVAGLNSAGGDPSPLTALGVFAAIQKTAEEKLNIQMSDLHVAIQGVGHVGVYLVKHLRDAGSRVSMADIDEAKLRNLAAETGAEIIPTDSIMTIECDIFAPCAMGAILSEETIPDLKCKAVVGAANNQLKEIEDAQRMEAAGILYAPDYLVNAGGIINVHFEMQPGGYNPEKAEQAAIDIGNTLMEVFALAEQEGITTAEAADKLAERRIAKHRPQH